MQRNVLRSGLIALCLLLVACGQDARLGKAVDEAARRITVLEQAIAAGDLRNAQLIEQYADVLEKERPELRQIVATLRREATVEGQQFRSLQRRLDELRRLLRDYGDPDLILGEARSLAAAADPANFDDELADVVNTLADMSDGRLPRVAVPPGADQGAVEKLGPGSRLVGNPSYGQWVDRGGMSFWEWYGMYSLFSNLMGGPVRYGVWDRYRPYSHYQDRALDRYGSPLTRRRWGRHWGSSRVKSSTTGRSQPRRSRFSRAPASGRRGPTGSLRRSSTYRRGFRGGK